MKANSIRLSFQGLHTQDKKGNKENCIYQFFAVVNSMLNQERQKKKISYENLLPIGNHYRSLQSKFMLPFEK